MYYVRTDTQLMAVSGNVHVHITDIGCSDHFLVWMKLAWKILRIKRDH